LDDESVLVELEPGAEVVEFAPGVVGALAPKYWNCLL